MENYKNSKIGRETAKKYGDILEMERPQTEESLRKHPRMTLQNRAKIFSPFAALRGYDEQLAAEKQRTERVTKRILTKEEMPSSVPLSTMPAVRSQKTGNADGGWLHR